MSEDLTTSGGSGASQTRANDERDVGLDGAEILVVDDETMVCMDICYALEDKGADVTPAYSLAEAVDMARGRDFVGAVLDVDLSGLEVFPAADLLSHKSVPIVFHTAHADPKNLLTRYPGTRVCPKPCVIDDLLDTLCELLP